MKEFYYQFHITKRCNLRCSHCYQQGINVSNETEENLFYIADAILKSAKIWNKLARISLTGGEPFLSPFIFKLLDFFQESDNVSSIGVLTNGTLINDEIVSNLLKYSKLREIQISIDGPSAEIHDKIRGVGSFNKSIVGIKKLVEAKIPVSIMFTLSKFNYDDVPSIINFAYAQRVNFLTIERIVSSNYNINIPPNELKMIYETIENWVAPDNNHKLIIRKTRPLWALVNEKNGGFCPVGFSSIAILEDGTILPCRRLELPIGNVMADRGLFKAWYTSKILWDIRNKSLIKNGCSNCTNLFQCGGCRAISYALTNNYMERDPLCWKTVK